MDKISLAGLAVAFAAILGGQVLEGGHIGSLVQLTAFVIVIGGTMGAVMLQSSVAVFVRGTAMLRWTLFPPHLDPAATIASVVAWAQTARKGGLLALEPMIDWLSSEFDRKGLQLLVDGAEPEMLRQTLELEINAYEERQWQAAKIWDAAGGYAPTIGILGAVMGLIHVMENLTDPSKLGSGIAVAFVATIYGVGSANLLFLPIANKLKAIVGCDVMQREMLVEGLVAIANGEHPRVIERRLQGYLA